MTGAAKPIPSRDGIHHQAHSNRVRVFELFQPLAHRAFGNFQPPRDFPIAQATVVAQQLHDLFVDFVSPQHGFPPTRRSWIASF